MTTRLSPLAESAIASTSTLGAVEIDVASAAPIALTKQGVASPNGLVSSSATTVPLVIKGAVGQTADMLDIDTSHSTQANPATINFSGNVAGSAERIGVCSPGVLFDGLQMASGQSTQLIGYYGLVLQGNAQASTGPGFAGLLGDRAVQIPITHATDMGLVIQGQVSQSGDLQQWQDSTGASLARIQSSGWGNFPYLSVTNGITNASNSGAWINYNYSGNSVTISQRVANAVGCIVQGAASQTGDLQQWQNSAGTPLAKVDASGNLSCGTIASGSITVGSFQPCAFTGAVSTGALTAGAGWATNPTFVWLTVQGAASQTGDLQQWQSSTSAVLANIDKAGRFGSAHVEAVTAVAGANAGTTPPAPVVTGSTDMRGLVTWGTGTTPAAGAQVAVTFPTAWAIAPYVVVTPINAATAALLPYVAAATTSGFTISTQAAPAASQVNTTYGVQFHVLG